ncbi:MAG: P1 family peptidase [Chloroflexi bacterium]|nr:P1 family peptidase [Chloroflexota bacterium]
MRDLQDAGGLTDVAGLKVGHLTHPAAATGCTVVLAEDGATAAVDVRGAAPATRETDLLRADNLVQQAHAVVLSGGSAFGLDAASGVMRYLEERGIGYRARNAIVPIVPGASLFDLGIGQAATRPTADDGYRACLAADAGPIAEGRVGAGTGATVGKLFGMPRCTKAGIGTASLKLLDGSTVAALVAVNAFGDVVDPRTDSVVAGARLPNGSFANTSVQLLQGVRLPNAAGNTVLAVVASDASLSRVELQRIAVMAHDGLGRVIRPAHTPVDGDAVFALCTGRHAGQTDLLTLGVAASEVLVEAVLRAVWHASSVAGVPSARELAER